MAKSAIIQILVNQESEDDVDQIKKSAEELKKQTADDADQMNDALTSSIQAMIDPHGFRRFWPVSCSSHRGLAGPTEFWGQSGVNKPSQAKLV
jgi:hypothetical protein